MTYTGLGPESGVLPCGRGGGSQVVSSCLHPDTSVKKHPGSTGEDRPALLEKSPSLCSGRTTLSVTAGRHTVQQAYCECWTPADCFWEKGMRKLFSNSVWRQSSVTLKRQKPTQLEGKIEASTSPVLGTGRDSGPQGWSSSRSWSLTCLSLVSDYWLWGTKVWLRNCPLGLVCEIKSSTLFLPFSGLTDWELREPEIFPNPHQDLRETRLSVP